MNKRRREKSPVSENSLLRNLHGVENIEVNDDELSDSFLENIESSDSDNETNSSDSDSENIFGDDTDEDPDFDPSTIMSEESSGEEVVPSTSKCEFRGRPRVKKRTSVVQRNINQVTDDVLQPGNVNNTYVQEYQVINKNPFLGQEKAGTTCLDQNLSGPNENLSDPTSMSNDEGLAPAIAVNNLDRIINDVVQGLFDPNILDQLQVNVTSLNENLPEPEPTENIEWTRVDDGNDPGYVHDFTYNEIPGPKHAPHSDAKPIEYFNLFFTLGLLNTFVLRTNQYAMQYINSLANMSPHSSARMWKPVNLTEMKGFIAVILNMGVVRKPTIRSYWSTSASQGTPWFRDMFSRNRFESLLQFFHVADNRSLPKPNEPNYDPCGKFLPVMEHANRIFWTYYTPHRELSIDESLVGTKSHSKILQYLPNKHHHKWGIKLWMLCDSVTKYCLAFDCYKGSKKNDGIKEHCLAYKVVKNLLSICQYLNKGYHIFLDNFFVSLPLAEYLYSKCTFLTGTVRRNRKGIPEEIKENLDVGEKKYVRSGPNLFLSYREKKSQKKSVILLSTKGTAKSVEKIKRRGNDNVVKIKPELINTYNMYMGGVDSSDQMLYCYLDERRTVKYWKKVVFNIFARMILNAYIIYKENCTGKQLTRLQFTIEIIEELAREWLNCKSRPATMAGAGGDDGSQNNFGMEYLPERKERNCSVCSKASTAAGGTRKKSRTICIKCKKGVHAICFNQHKC